MAVTLGISQPDPQTHSTAQRTLDRTVEAILAKVGWNWQFHRVKRTKKGIRSSDF